MSIIEQTGRLAARLTRGNEGQVANTSPSHSRITLTQLFRTRIHLPGSENHKEALSQLAIQVGRGKQEVNVDYFHPETASDEVKQMIAETQAIVHDALTHNRPVYISQLKRFGDNLIYRWAVQSTLETFCELNNIPIANINIQSFTHDMLDRTDRIDYGHKPNLSSRTNRIYYDYTHGDTIDPKLLDHLPKDLYSEELVKISMVLGLPLDLVPTLRERIPLPLKTDRGFLEDFDMEEVERRGLALRDAILRDGTYRTVCMIMQNGSNAEKRFSDKQIEELIRHAKETMDSPYIIVVTDRKLLGQSIASGEYAGEDAAFPIDRPEYQQSTLDSTNFATQADTIFQTGGDINELGALSYASDIGITTDSGPAWLFAGIKAGQQVPWKLIDLYTIADSDHWYIPRINNVPSAAKPQLQDWFDSFLNRNAIAQHMMYAKIFQTKECPHFRGVSSSDIQLVKQELVKVTKELETPSQ